MQASASRLPVAGVEALLASLAGVEIDVLFVARISTSRRSVRKLGTALAPFAAKPRAALLTVRFARLAKPRSFRPSHSLRSAIYNPRHPANEVLDPLGRAPASRRSYHRSRKTS
jgi:hypothetical protein